jgi:DNA-binding transcriptional regulator YiaG
MTPLEFKEARRKLGLSAAQMGRAIGLTGDPGRTVRRYEAGDIEISGPVQVAIRYILRHGLDKQARDSI